MNRRNWLKANVSAAAGLTIAPTALSFSFKPKVIAGEIRLNSNENPLGPSKAARRAIIDALDLGCRYPSEHYQKLEMMIAEKEGLSPDYVVLGAGSSEILRIAGYAYGIAGGEIMTPYPTYESMERNASQIGAHVHHVPLDENLMIDLGAMDRHTTQAVKLVYVCNPNNPTGTVLPGAAVKSFCEEVSRRTIVYVDV